MTIYSLITAKNLFDVDRLFYKSALPIMQSLTFSHLSDAFGGQEKDWLHDQLPVFHIILQTSAYNQVQIQCLMKPTINSISTRTLIISTDEK